MKIYQKFYSTIFLITAFSSSLIAQETLSIKTNTYKQDYNKAQKYVDSGKYKNALPFLNSSISKRPDYIDAYFVRATVKELLEDSNGALNDYNIIVGLSPNHTEAIFGRALIRYRLKHYVPALNDFLKLLRTPSSETQAVYFRKSMFENTADKMITIQSGNKPTLYNYIGLVYTALNKYDSAIIYCDSAIYARPSEADYYLNRGMAKVKRGTLDEATEDFNQALVIEPAHALAQYNLTILSTEISDNEKLIETLTKIIQTDSTLAYAYTNRGTARLNIGDYNGAQSDYNVALLLDENNANNWMNSGLAKSKLNDLSGAFNDFSKALELEPKSEKALLNLGNVLYKMQDYKKAIDFYGLAILYHPESSNAYYNRALANYNTGNKNEACQDLTNAKKLGFTITKQVFSNICTKSN